MGFSEAMFMLQFLICIGIILLETYNLMNMTKVYDMKITFILFMSYFLFWGIGFSIFILDAGETLIYMAMIQVESWLLLLHGVYLLFSVIFFLKEIALNEADRHSRTPTLQRPN